MFLKKILELIQKQCQSDAIVVMTRGEKNTLLYDGNNFKSIAVKKSKFCFEKIEHI